MLLSLVTAGSILFGFGLPPAVIRIVGQLRRQRDIQAIPSLIRATMLSTVAVALLIGLVLVCSHLIERVITLFHLGPSAGLGAYATAWLIVSVIQPIIGESLRSQQDIRGAVIFGSFGTVVAVGSTGGLLVLYLLNHRVSLEAIILLYLVVIGASTLLGLIVLEILHLRPMTASVPSRRAPRPTTALGVRLAIVAWPLWIGTIAHSITSQVGLWVIASNAGARSAALYGIGTNFAAIVGVPLMVVNAVLPPTIAESGRSDWSGTLGPVVRRFSTAATAAAVVSFTGLLLFARSIIGIVYGDAYYHHAYAVVAFLCAGQLANVATGSATLVLSMSGYQSSVMRLSVTAAIVSLSLTEIGVRFGGVSGGALAYGVSIFLENGLIVFIAFQKTGIKTWASCAEIVGIMGRLRR